MLWEAQFGDFINGAQIIVDQYLVAAEDKWGQHNGLVLLLPHGYEGQGPEHSSARMERFLIQCAEDNIQVCNATTAAQYFHLLRRQVHTERHTPLILFTPKQGLRMKQTRSTVDELTTGSFQEILDDPFVTDRDAVRRIVFCSGKVAWDAMAERDKREAPVAVVRVEQLYPSPIDQLVTLLETYPNARELVWLQEEPENMGAWSFVEGRVWRIKERGYDLRHVARVESGSPATGSKTIHDQELADLMDETFAGLLTPAFPNGSSTRRPRSWSSESTSSRKRSRQRDAQDVGELGDGRARVADLDRRHAHRLGGLEVDAEVVEEHALGRLDAEQLARRLVEPRLGLAHADLARLDDDVEAGHHGGDLGPAAVGLVVRLTTLFVRQAVLYPAACTLSSAVTISGRTSPASSASTSAPGTSWPSAADSAAKATSNSAWSSSARSSRAHALTSGSVAFTERMKSSGIPRCPS